jgi:hypothetical protein
MLLSGEDDVMFDRIGNWFRSQSEKKRLSTSGKKLLDELIAIAELVIGEGTVMGFSKTSKNYAEVFVEYEVLLAGAGTRQVSDDEKRVQLVSRKLMLVYYPDINEHHFATSHITSK